MGHSQLAFGITKPTTLDEALTVIERLSGSVASVCADGVDHSRRVFPDTERLIAARRAIKSGRHDDALYEIEKVLSGLDSAWMCRA